MAQLLSCSLYNGWVVGQVKKWIGRWIDGFLVGWKGEWVGNEAKFQRNV